ncbi:hypothetical protein MAR_033529, partial [Mya arenaria]
MSIVENIVRAAVDTLSVKLGSNDCIQDPCDLTLKCLSPCQTVQEKDCPQKKQDALWETTLHVIHAIVKSDDDIS